MRIISGKYGRRRFTVPKGLKLRPTTDLAKEGIFGMLQSIIEFEGIEVLDLFSGTGNIGLEFASRGASKVIFLDKQHKHTSFVKSVIEELDAKDYCSTYTKDVLSFLKNPQLLLNEASFDLIFADPPYNLPCLEDIPELLFTSNLLKENGLFILEHPSEYNFSKHPNFVKHKQYSAVNFSLFSNSRKE